jgi:hypothetical protein
MALFYFNLHTPRGDTLDEEGQEHPDVEAAHKAAIAKARDLLCAELQQGELHLSSYIEIVDERRQPVFTLSFDEAVTIRL